ncbi:hypothetical protein BN59_00333 [Legionella massiliensis]|uniref:DUF4254 domain-containing protein n=1 Tax=Legionella massiliensis TaxID=1034943 RepID=A0A078KWE0_9GAMM|nr:DUF4254 domain-containing protein [Legionella massiliensis]CDZ76069.1 hypothetical protein BN59_00333 [Legionella massiliensis]CEE11807.1 hypothetical protein BN1094_00333 [Legionella massiliensis]
MTNLVQATEIAIMQRDCIVLWKKSGLKLSQQDFLALAEENHSFNYQLWHAEDRARRDDMGHEFVYLAKREIDHCNQQRNNRMEAMDEWLYNKLQPSTSDECFVHSETPGMMIDRLSILALKAYHMNLQSQRQDVDETHRQHCQRKWQTLITQQNQLVTCLQQLFDEIRDGTRTFKVYHQFKMYNDPTLNPQLYDAKV